MQPGKVFYDRRAEACSADLTGSATVGAEETLEDSVLMLGEDPFAGIGNSNDRSRFASLNIYRRRSQICAIL